MVSVGPILFLKESYLRDIMKVTRGPTGWNRSKASLGCPWNRKRIKKSKETRKVQGQVRIQMGSLIPVFTLSSLFICDPQRKRIICCICNLPDGLLFLILFIFGTGRLQGYKQLLPRN